MKLNDRGVLHAPLALLSCILILTSLGLWSLLHHWKGLMEIQLHLDHCTGKTAMDLKNKLEEIQRANEHILKLRAAEAAALIAAPETVPALKALVVAEAIRQESLRGLWALKQTEWTLGAGCGERGDFTLPLTSLNWVRSPEDGLGPQAISMSQLPQTFLFQALHSSRAAAAEVFTGGHENATFVSQSWHARWVSPAGFIRTSFP